MKVFIRFDAEREGFEPPEVLPSTVFKTAAIDHSATSPCFTYRFRLVCVAKLILFFLTAKFF